MNMFFLPRLLPDSAWVLCAVRGRDRELYTFRANSTERDSAAEWIDTRRFCDEIKVLALNIFPQGKTVLHYAFKNLHII